MGMRWRHGRCPRQEPSGDTWTNPERKSVSKWSQNALNGLKEACSAMFMVGCGLAESLVVHDLLEAAELEHVLKHDFERLRLSWTEFLDTKQEVAKFGVFDV